MVISFEVCCSKSHLTRSHTLEDFFSLWNCAKNDYLKFDPFSYVLCYYWSMTLKLIAGWQCDSVFREALINNFRYQEACEWYTVIDYVSFDHSCSYNHEGKNQDTSSSQHLTEIEKRKNKKTLSNALLHHFKPTLWLLWHPAVSTAIWPTWGSKPFICIHLYAVTFPVSLCKKVKR